MNNIYSSAANLRKIFNYYNVPNNDFSTKSQIM